MARLSAFTSSEANEPTSLPVLQGGDDEGRCLGEPFAAALEKMPVGEWVGPIASSFGAHYVRVLARTPAVAAQLADVRDQVAREWENARRQRARNDAYTKMRSRYEVSIEARPGAERP